MGLRGYQTPLATLKTLLWAMNNGDSDAYLASCAPEVKARTRGVAGKTKAELSRRANELGTVTGVKSWTRRPYPATVSSSRLFPKAMGKTNKVAFRKVATSGRPVG